MGGEGGDPERRLRELILGHFRDAPDAADTAQGIAGWWGSDVQPLQEELVERVLEHLVAEGLVERRSLPDGTRIYCAPRG